MSIAPETKSADPAADASRAFDEFARAFEAFKDTNDSRLSRIETRLSGDVVTEEKLARIGDVLDEHTRRIDRVTLDARRPALAGAAADARDPAVAEHKAAFDLYVRAGEAAGLKHLEAKALSAGSGPDGGYLVPDTIERGLACRQREKFAERAMPASIYEQLHRDGLAARDARLKAEQDQDELASLRHGKASLRLDLALIRLRRALRRKDRTDQPRVPAGQVGGGQFTEGGSGRGSNPVSRARRLAEVIRVCVLSGVSRTMNGHGVKTHTAEYECPGGQTFKRQGFGHNPPGLVRDPFE